MDRRDFLGLTGSFILSPYISWIKKKKLFGWIPGNHSKQPSIYQISNLEGFGSNKLACLWKAWEAVTKRPWTPHAQKVGDCVAHGSGSSVDFLTCTSIIIMRKQHKYITDSSTDAIYSGCRNLIAPYKLRGDGAQGEWAVKYLKKYGNLLRQQYPPYDLTPYSYETVRYWDNNGLPESLLTEAKKHPVSHYALVTSWEEVRDSVAAGKPVIFCAMIGADDDRRDEDGFIKPRGTWPHCWCIAGVQDGKRPGACLINSHGPLFGKGPKTHGQPDGSVWIDAKYIDNAVKKERDSFAISNYKGFEAPEEDYIIW